MPIYKLTYFNARGLAELARLLFAEAGVEYDDIRIEREEWPDVKPTTPLGQLPMLQVDDLYIPQSKAFCRYLAREFGLYGATSYENACVDVVMETIDDLLQGLRRFMVEPDEAIKEKKKAEYFSEDGQGPASMKRLVKLLGEKDYFLGDKVNLADFNMLIAGDWYLYANDKGLEGFQSLVDHRKRVMERPNIAKWLEARPKTEY